MEVKTKVRVDHPRQTDAADGLVTGRDYRALLRSTGHLFRDGRWTGDDDPFHVYRDLENPGLGTLRTFVGPKDYFKGYDPQFPQFGPSANFSWRPALGRAYSYAFYNDVYEEPIPDPVVPSYADHSLGLNAAGTSYIARMRPGNPLGSLGQFLGELHELPRLPALFRSRAKHFRDIGSDYLNVQFGWKPFVEDVINFGHTQLRLQEELNRLVKNNGIKVKRRSKHELVVTGDEWVYADPVDRPFGFIDGFDVDGHGVEQDFYCFGPYNTGADSHITGERLVSYRSETRVETWFVGTFAYYVPDIGSSEWNNRAKLILSGLMPTPAVLYQVFPWTWLADWFGNVGKILSNLSSNAVDSEVLLDPHIMRKIVTRYDIEAQVSWDYHEQQIGGIPFTAVSPGSDKLSYSHIRTEKLRQKASPFGFGLRTEQFTTAQKAILAALLFSKKRPTLRSFGLS